MWPTIWASVALAGGLAIAGGGLYLEGKKSGRNEQIAKQATIDQVAAEFERKVAHVTAQAISKIEVKNVTVRQQLEREVLTREVFRDCRSGPAAVGLLNGSPGIAAEPAESAGGGVVPAAAAPR